MWMVSKWSEICVAGLDQDVDALKYYEMSSFAEAKAKGYAMDPVKAPKCIARNRRQLARCGACDAGWHGGNGHAGRIRRGSA